MTLKNKKNFSATPDIHENLVIVLASCRQKKRSKVEKREKDITGTCIKVYSRIMVNVALQQFHLHTNSKKEKVATVE
jgi:hypothetical protein